MNSVNTNIQFEVEPEKDNSINFLDIQITRKENNSLSFGVYRKETHTGKYLDFRSYNPLSHKRSVALSLFRRAKTICGSDEEKKNEDLLIKKQLLENNYPASFIRKCYNKINHSRGDKIDKDGNVKYVKVPYIQGKSERLARLLRPLNISLALKPSNTLSGKLQNLKDKITTNEKNSVVYKIECNDCDSSYIGETGRPLGTRLSEHQANIRTLYDRSQLVEHMVTHNHTFDFNGASILAAHKQDRSRRILEACHTHTTRDSINRALELPPVYTNVANAILGDNTS